MNADLPRHVWCGDATTVMRTLPDNSVDSIVTDPPYGLAEHKTENIVKAMTAWCSGDRDHVPDGKGFMGRKWDAFVPPPAVWDECMRVLKPGGWLLCFAGTRTMDLMGLSIRLAGFEMRDSIGNGTMAWTYGSGFPKSKNVALSIDKLNGHPNRGKAIPTASTHLPHGKYVEEVLKSNAVDAYEAKEPAARPWQGWGTALKPAWEPIIVARKPFTGTVAANVLAHGTGALNIDGCRVAADWATDPNRRGWQGGNSQSVGVTGNFGNTGERVAQPNEGGRWPANVVLSHSPECNGECQSDCPVAELDAQSGISRSSAGSRGKRHGVIYGGGKGPTGPDGVRGHTDEGGASRFFPTFKYAQDEIERDANGCVPGCPVAELDAQSGTLKAGGTTRGTKRSGGIMGTSEAQAREQFEGYGDPGGASRYFPTFRYQAKAPTSERPKIPVPPKLRMRGDLTSEQRAYVLDELRKAGVDVA